MKHFLKLLDCTTEEIYELLDLAATMKQYVKEGKEHHFLKGKTLGMIFEKSSTRTRISFETGMYQLGGHALFISARDSQIGRGEPTQDTARVMSRMLDGIMIRTFEQKEVEMLAEYGSIPIINGLTDLCHPCQVMADLLTIREHKGKLEGLTMCYIGDGNNMANSLSNSEGTRRSFIANVSHELKTPLAVIQNYGTMLQQPGLSEEKRLEYAKAVTDASRRLAHLITNILKLNKLENQQIFPQAETYDLGEQLCQCLLTFENAWEEKGLDIQTDIQENVLVEADSELLSLVWNNLFSNAVKFTEPGGTLSLTLEVQEDLAVVRVGDTGCGIPPEVGRHIFEKFYQGDTSHATQGNGLGLALVKRVMDIVGGDISVESQVGVGSVFTVKLRRKRDGLEETAP